MAEAPWMEAAGPMRAPMRGHLQTLVFSWMEELSLTRAGMGVWRRMVVSPLLMRGSLRMAGKGTAVRETAGRESMEDAPMPVSMAAHRRMLGKERTEATSSWAKTAAS
jgi:hypothetical protein